MPDQSTSDGTQAAAAAAAALIPACSTMCRTSAMHGRQRRGSAPFQGVSSPPPLLPPPLWDRRDAG
eukprot:SAG22_NODE_151_length_17414_cov_7.812128_4_plen_66_part_00